MRSARGALRLPLCASRLALPALRFPPCASRLALPALRFALPACRLAFRLLSGGFFGTHLSAMCMRSKQRSAEFQFRATVHGLLRGSARHLNRALLALLGAVALAALSSCKKSAPGDSAEERAHPSRSSNHQSEVIARVHWLGKKQI